MASALWKIPFIAAAAASFHVTATPPTTPPSKEELILPNTCTEKLLTDILSRISGPGTPKILFWTASLCEMAVIVASRTSYSPLSDAVLRVLAPAGPPYTSSINLTKSYVTGSVLAVLGGALRYWCYRTLGRMFTFRLSIVRDHRLITTGPYGIVRHPSYTGILLAIPGIQLCMLGPGSWLRESGMLGKVWGKVFLVYWGVLCAAAYPSVVARVPKEDEMMRNRFGVEWEQWAKQVAYRIIPGMY